MRWEAVHERTAHLSPAERWAALDDLDRQRYKARRLERERLRAEGDGVAISRS